jgi:hypothetical protein
LPRDLGARWTRCGAEHEVRWERPVAPVRHVEGLGDHLDPPIAPPEGSTHPYVAFHEAGAASRVAADARWPVGVFVPITVHVESHDHVVRQRTSCGDDRSEAPFDLTTLAVTGAAVPLVEDVAQQGPTAHFAISSYGALVYVPRDALEGPQRARTLVWIDRQGREVGIKVPLRPYFYPRLSPDGTRVALEIRDQDHDIWILDLARETFTRLTGGPMFAQYGVWTPDGRDVIYSSAQLGGPNAPRSLFRRRADGTGTVEQLTHGVVAQQPSTVTPDGSALIFREHTPRRIGTGQGMDLVLLPLLKGERQPRPLLPTPFDELNAEVSRDGHWVAYQSNESGRNEIYVRPFPNVDGGKRTISTNGGRQPLWARSGQELFYESAGALMSVPIRIGSTFEAGTARKVVDFPYVPGTAEEGLGRMYDVSPDGQRFLMIKELKEPSNRAPFARMILVQNSLEELKRLTPAK